VNPFRDEAGLSVYKEETMFFKQWEVLLVDDDPDVNRITRLAMRSFDVYGIPLRLSTAASKAEAVELLSTSLEWMPLVAVAFIDVVMETDTAGLELCDYMRNTMDNKLTQIYIRTGQPGIAPERRVIDDYDINGYFTKMETTEDKLYSLVKAGIRQYLWNHFASGAMQFFDHMIAATGSRDLLAETAHQMLRGFVMTAGGTTPESMEVQSCLWIGDREVSRLGVDSAGAQQLRAHLNGLDHRELGPGGDYFTNDDRDNYLIHIASSDPTSELVYVCNTQFHIPPFIMQVVYRVFAGLSKAWEVSGAPVASAVG
jgi:CheY-like chemotaxis protein